MRFADRRAEKVREAFNNVARPAPGYEGLTIDDVWCGGCSGTAADCRCADPQDWFVKNRDTGDESDARNAS